MNDLQLLFVVLAVLYLWECVCWIRRGSVTCLNWFGSRWRIARPGEFIGNQQGGFVLTNPLPPLGSIVAGNQLPLSLSPHGLLTWVSTSAGSNARPQQIPKFFPFAEIKTISARNRKLFINDQLVLKLSSVTFAAHVAKQIEKIKSHSEKERPSVIERIFRESLDAKVIGKRWDDFQEATTSIWWLANGLVLYLFAFAPAIIWQFGLRTTWLSLLIGLFTLTVSIAIFFHRAHKSFFPAAEDDRFTHVIMVALAPATTPRARDILSRPLLESYHPLAVAKTFCAEAEFREFAGKVLRDLRHPFQPVCPAENVDWKETESFSRQTLQGVVEAFLKQNKIDPAELCRAPKPADETCCSYCPRCLAQFTVADGECADCGGLKLQSLKEVRVGKTTVMNSDQSRSTR